MSWIRKLGLTVGGSNLGDLDLSDMQVEFQTSQADIQEYAPTTCAIRIWNLKDETASSIKQEYQTVRLDAGYVQGNYGNIFQGTICMVRTGRLNAKDSFVDIFAADGDLIRFAQMNNTLQAGWTNKDVRQKIDESASKYNIHVDQNSLVGGIGPAGLRGKVLWGMTTQAMEDQTIQSGSSQTIDKNTIVFTPLDGYRPGTIIDLNTKTGLIGVPESMIDGVKAVMLLNPFIKIGTLVHINERDINQTTVKNLGYPNYGSGIPFFATVTADGIYKCFVVEHRGDTRGHDWYTTITCLAVDAATKGISPFGWSGMGPSGGGFDDSPDNLFDPVG